jgi:prophage tail gpP-like protein
MAKRPDHDEVKIESAEGGDASVVIDRATQYEIITDILSPSTARFELGDETTWEPLREAAKIGARMTVSVGGWPRLTGRLLTRNLALSASSGGTVQFAIRTRLADAMFSAVYPKIGVKNVSLKDLIVKAFSLDYEGNQTGVTESDFIFQANVAREILTGRSSPGRAAPEVRNMREDEARPHPPETVYQFVDRHLSRFGLIMWDAADGRIIVGTPDDAQRPLYQMTARRRPNSQANNLLSATKTEDFEEVPRDLWVFGVGGGKDQELAVVKFVALDDTLFGSSPRLFRSATIIDNDIRTQAQAEARARREMMRRSLQKDSWVLETDGFHHWDGSETLPYVVDTVADVQVDIAGGSSGAYLVYQVAMACNAQDGQRTRLTACGKGVWAL